MPQIAQRLREPAAFALLAYAALSTLFYTIDFLFAPADSCSGPYCSGTKFADRATVALGNVPSLILVIVLVAAMAIAHFGTQLKSAKIITLIALITAAVAELIGVIALFSSFGSGEQAWSKTEGFFIGAAQLAILGIVTWIILGYYQQHAPARPAGGFPGQPPQGFQQQQWQQPGQWQQQSPQGQAPPPPPQPQWGQQAPQSQQPPAQTWGPPPPPPPGQAGFSAPSAESMATQVIPAAPQNPPAPPAPPTSEGQHLPPVGNWTAE